MFQFRVYIIEILVFSEWKRVDFQNQILCISVDTYPSNSNKYYVFGMFIAHSKLVVLTSASQLWIQRGRGGILAIISTLHKYN